MSESGRRVIHALNNVVDQSLCDQQGFANLAKTGKSAAGTDVDDHFGVILINNVLGRGCSSDFAPAGVKKEAGLTIYFGLEVCSGQTLLN